MGYCRSRGANFYVTGEYHNFVWHRATKSGCQLALSLQGSHSTADAMVDFPPALGNSASVTGALADAGYLVLGGDLAQTPSQGTYGSDTAVTRVGQLKTFAAAPVVATVPVPTGKAYIICGSGGATAAINYARANPSQVAAIVATCPLTAVEALYDNATALTAASVTQAEMRTAYGAVDTTAFRALMPTRDPAVANLAGLASVPIKIYYSTDDPIIPFSSITAFRDRVVAAGGTCQLVSLGAVGHSANGLDPYQVAAFFDAN